MTEHPIIMRDHDVRATIAGKKTQTRRVVKPSVKDATGVGAYTFGDDIELVNTYEGEAMDEPPITCPYGSPGDALWVREAWALVWASKDPETGITDDWGNHRGPIPDAKPAHESLVYRADDHPTSFEDRGWNWHPSIHMPRWASRLTLDVVSVRVERVQDISEADIAAEGIDAAIAERLVRDTPGSLRALVEVTHSRLSDPRECWRIAWTLINGAESWRANPWCWAIGFRRRP